MKTFAIVLVAVGVILGMVGYAYRSGQNQVADAERTKTEHIAENKQQIRKIGESMCAHNEAVDLQNGVSTASAHAKLDKCLAIVERN